DGAGGLSGYAYGANIGWVAFEQTNGQPRISLLTGKFSGYAWSGNVGWISLSNAQAHVQTDVFATGPDSDADGLPDPWEYRRAGDLVTMGGGTNDWDNDGATDTEEYGADTHPRGSLSLLAIVSFTKGATVDTVEWTCQPTRLYRVEGTNTLPEGVSGGWWDAVGLIGPPTNATTTLVVPVGVISSTRFFRVKAVLPLSASP
ncbi:MAG TPA: hypothetical protein PK388_07345, partial [Kiritimatiellia bacterium]|nr:hypothetical protein [Kiritimatiellia bacterium]